MMDAEVDENDVDGGDTDEEEDKNTQRSKQK